MMKPGFRFSSLRRMLLDLGFEEVRGLRDHGIPEGPIKRTFIGFKHDDSDTLIELPGYYRSKSWVYPHHLIYVRITLDAKGLMDAEEFERRVAQDSVLPSASG